MIEFFKIGTTDLTDAMDYQNYSMNKAHDYDKEWRDGNQIDHRPWIRDRIEGEFQLAFYTNAGYNAFLSLMSSSASADGYYSVTAYVQNTNTTESFDAFIDYTSESKFDFTNGRQYHMIEMTVRQR